MEEVEGGKRKKERTVSKINRFQQFFRSALFLSLTGPTALPVTAAEVKAFRAEPLVVCRPKCQLPLPPPLPSSRTPPRLRVVKFYTLGCCERCVSGSDPPSRCSVSRPAASAAPRYLHVAATMSASAPEGDEALKMSSRRERSSQGGATDGE